MHVLAPKLHKIPSGARFIIAGNVLVSNKASMLHQHSNYVTTK